MREALTTFLGERLSRPADIVGLQRIAVGHSRAMFRVELAGGERFVVRVEQGGVFATSSELEFAVMEWLHDVGFPVARVRWLEPTGEVLGQPFFVMDHIDGAASGGDDRALTPAAAEMFVATLTRLHDLEPPEPGTVFGDRTVGDAVDAEIGRWAEVHHHSVAAPLPLLEEAATWLAHRAPTTDRLSVVHGDAGPGNLVVVDDRLLAVTDFEFTHLGDRREDWSFCVAMRGRRTMAPAEWRRLIAGVAGLEMDAEEWRWWEAFNLFKGACANLTAADLFTRGVNRAPNMAIIGSRIHAVFLRRLADLVAA